MSEDRLEDLKNHAVLIWRTDGEEAAEIVDWAVEEILESRRKTTELRAEVSTLQAKEI